MYAVSVIGMEAVNLISSLVESSGITQTDGIEDIVLGVCARHEGSVQEALHIV